MSKRGIRNRSALLRAHVTRAVEPAKSAFERVPEDGDPISQWDEHAREALALDHRPLRHHTIDGCVPEDEDERREFRRRREAENTKLRDAFTKHKLDPLEPGHWRTIVLWYAQVEFGLNPRKAGRKAGADDDARMKAARKIVRNLRSGKHPVTKAKIVERMVTQDLGNESGLKRWLSKIDLAAL